MSRSIRKLIAILLAVWLPLFGGNALAGSVAMQSKGGDCHAAVAQQNEHHSQTTHQHAHQAQLAANHDIPSGHHDQPNSSCKNHAICHLVCCGYVASSVLVIVAAQPADRAFTPYLATPHTLTLPLFDPPPLARA